MRRVLPIAATALAKAATRHRSQSIESQWEDSCVRAGRPRHKPFAIEIVPATTTLPSIVIGPIATDRPTGIAYWRCIVDRHNSQPSVANLLPKLHVASLRVERYLLVRFPRAGWISCTMGKWFRRFLFRAFRLSSRQQIVPNNSGYRHAAPGGCP